MNKLYYLIFLEWWLMCSLVIGLFVLVFGAVGVLAGEYPPSFIEHTTLVAITLLLSFTVSLQKATKNNLF